MELNSIALYNISEIIPNMLYSKFEQNNIKTVGDVKKIELNAFQKFPYVGKKVCELFLVFKEKIETSPEEIIDIYKSTLPKELPINYSEESSFIVIFSSIILDYLKITKDFNHKSKKAKEKQLRNVDIIQKYFGINSKIYTREQIGVRHRINSERVRQIIVDIFYRDISSLLNDEFLESWNLRINKNALELLHSFKKDIAGTYALNEKDISNWLKEYGINEELNSKREFFDLLFKIWGYNKVKTSRHHYLRNNQIYLSNSIDSELFLNVSTKIYTFLEKRVIPTTLEDIIIEVLEEFDVSDEFIQLCCDTIYEIEKTDTLTYQMKFEKLSSINDYTFRLLYEKKKTLSYNELLHLINQRLVQVDQAITLQTLKQTLKKDENVVPLGKTGNWTLAILDPNVDSQIDLILKSFRIHDKPLSEREILNHIHSEYSRVDVSERSVSSNLRNYKEKFKKVKGKKFILSEWEYKYKNDIVKSRIVNNKKSTQLKAEKTVEVVKRYLGSDNSEVIYLRDLVKLITTTETDFSRMDIYKAISQNPLVFNKIQLNEKIFVGLKTNNQDSRNQITVKYKWNELKKILIRELEPIFNSSSQPNYSNSLEEALDAFFKILTKDLPVEISQFNGLADRILPTLYKYYVESSDRNDKLNFLKQIVTSQESFFKILLYYFHNPDYQYVDNHNKGFGVVLERLAKVDKRDNRYKDLRTASIYEFGKHCSRAYNNRNLDTHNATDWTEGEIIETKTSCLVMMIYACFEYYNEINRI
ncbi:MULTISPECIES: hypothetical protein [Empedobacter]|uniref:hypothetical protein n=1 Tax=Empedobacter TaxID=59734 RepID=UPI001C8E97EA|nr:MULTISPECIES: hypothetical protein [Empedobacter]MBY0067840.1 hypothetical protein [Empedobacter falsenii]